MRRDASEALLKVRYSYTSQVFEREETSFVCLSLLLFTTASLLVALLHRQLRQQHSISSGIADGPILPGLLASVTNHPLPLEPVFRSKTQNGIDADSSVASSSSDPVEVEAPASNPELSGKRRPAPSGTNSAVQDLLDRGGLRVLCRSRAQVEAASAVPWL